MSQVLIEKPEPEQCKVGSVSRPVKAAFLTEIPTPYRDPLFERISEIEGSDLTVLYCAPTERGRNWTIPPNTKTKYKILKGFLWTFSGNDIFAYKINFSIWRELSEGNYDCVLIGGYAHLTMQIAALWCRLHHVPYVLVSETHGLNKRSLWKRVIKYPIVKSIVKGATAYLPTGNNALDYIAHYGGDRSKAFFMPNTPDADRLCIESANYRGQKEKNKTALGIKTKYILFFAGRLTAVKGLEYLFQAFQLLLQEGFDVSLLVAGSGPLEQRFKEEAAVKGIKNVYFLGFVPNKDLSKLFSLSDVLVLPSWSETWGAVLNEAMACGLPVIATHKVGSARDLIEPGKNGFIVKERDSREILFAVKKIFENDALRLQMGERSTTIAKKWGYNLCLASFQEAIRQTLRQAKKRGSASRIRLPGSLARGIEKTRQVFSSKNIHLPVIARNLIVDFEWFLYRLEISGSKNELKPPERTVLINSIPKCGTNLFRNIVMSIPGTKLRDTLPSVLGEPDRLKRIESSKKVLSRAKCGEVYIGHLPYEPELASWLKERRIATLFIYRDPRGYVVSHFHHVMNSGPRHPDYELLKSMGSNEVRLMACIEGLGEGKTSSRLSKDSLLNVNLFYRLFLGWLKEDHVLSLRFKDFVGPEPAALANRRKALESILFHLGSASRSVSETTLDEILRRGMDPMKSSTFRVGEVGSWRKEFSPAHHRAFNLIANDLLKELGYDHDDCC